MNERILREKNGIGAAAEAARIIETDSFGRETAVQSIASKMILRCPCFVPASVKPILLVVCPVHGAASVVNAISRQSASKRRRQIAQSHPRNIASSIPRHREADLNLRSNKSSKLTL